MPALPLAVVLQIAASCAPAVHPETWLSVVHTESKFNPLSIGDNTTRQSYNRTAFVISMPRPVLARRPRS